MSECRWYGDSRFSPWREFYRTRLLGLAEMANGCLMLFMGARAPGWGYRAACWVASDRGRRGDMRPPSEEAENGE